MKIETVKYRVVSFPGDFPTRVMQAKDMEHAQQLVEKYADENPIIEKNVVTETGWEIQQ